MNTHLLPATLLNPALPATAPWAGSGPATDGGPSGAAFLRALEGARQSSLTASEPQRPSAPTANEPRQPSNAAPREAEGGSRSDRSERPEATERSDRPRRADSDDRAERGQSEAADERRPRGATVTRPTETARRAGPQAASRREGAGAPAASPAVPSHRHGDGPANEDSLITEGLHAGRAADATDVTDATKVDTPAALLADATAAHRAAPGEASAAATALLPRGSAAQATDASAAEVGDPRALALRAAGRGAGSEAQGPALEQDQGTAAGRNRAAGSATRRPGDEAASTAAVDPALLGLRSVLAEATSPRAAAGEGARMTDNVGALAAGSTTPSLPQGALAAALATPPGAATADAAGAVLEAGLRAPPGSEAFARELGAQVSVFVREGVQQARLHLNPQELGPVLVRIQLEGQAAQVHMAADLPQTRQALEQALPALASQLSESGITLTGGGVFERPPQGFTDREARGDEMARAAAPGSGTDAPAGSMAAATEPGRWSRPRGLVDLIA